MRKIQRRSHTDGLRRQAGGDQAGPPTCGLTRRRLGSDLRMRKTSPSTVERACGLAEASCTTDNLSGQDVDRFAVWLGWLGPVAVLGALDGPVAHLAFDDAWLGALPAFGERLGEDLSDRLPVGCGDAVGGKIPGGSGCCDARRGGFW
jgi:hypothetical protein